MGWEAVQGGEVEPRENNERKERRKLKIDGQVHTGQTNHMGMRSQVHRWEPFHQWGRRKEGWKLSGTKRRALTKNSAGERNCRKSIGQESVECGPKKHRELVSTPEQTILSLHTVWVTLQPNFVSHKLVHIARFGTGFRCVGVLLSNTDWIYVLPPPIGLALQARCASGTPLIWSW